MLEHHWIEHWGKALPEPKAGLKRGSKDPPPCAMSTFLSGIDIPTSGLGGNLCQ